MSVLRRFWDEHPRLSMWIVLSIGMVIIMVLAARQVGFDSGQWAWLIIVTIGLAGVCTWIISWEDEPLEDEEEEQGSADP